MEDAQVGQRDPFDDHWERLAIMRNDKISIAIHGQQISNISIDDGRWISEALRELLPTPDQ